MISFEKLKGIPKIDLHINFLTSISTSLAFELDDDLSFNQLMDMYESVNIGG